jgi:hypothetical protein
MSEFQKWFNRPKSKNWERATFQVDDDTLDISRTAIFINETLAVCQAIYKDLGLRDESLLLAIYDRFIDRFNSMDTSDPYGVCLKSGLRHIKLGKVLVMAEEQDK